MIHIYSTLWTNCRKLNIKLSHHSCALILLLIAGDIESQPGPSQQLFKNKGMHILHQNIRGLLGKFTQIQAFMDMNRNIEILTLSETHISDFDNNDDLYALPGYAFLSRSRTTGFGGGGAIYVKDNIDFQRRFDLEIKNVETIVIEINV